MQVFECILLILIFLITLGFLFKIHTRKTYKFICFIPFFIMIIHLVVENIKWTLYPLYFITCLYFLLGFIQLVIGYDIKRYKRWFNITFSLLILSIILNFIFPVYDMINPTGEYKIGTITYDLVDNERMEIYSEEENDYRKIKYQIWYPTDSTTGLKRQPWLEDGKKVSRGVSKMMGLPFFVLDQTAHIMSHSYQDALLSTKKDVYPVVIISHGWTGFRNLHTDISEKLASHGFIVVGIEHTYGSSATVFNDEVIYYNPDALPDRDTTPDFLDYANTLVNTYHQDIELVLNQ